MKAYKEKTVYVINTTPRELRALADKLERDFPNKLPGDSTCIDIFYSDDAMFKVCGDQGKYHEHKKGNNNPWV